MNDLNRRVVEYGERKILILQTCGLKEIVRVVNKYVISFTNPPILTFLQSISINLAL